MTKHRSCTGAVLALVLISGAVVAVSAGVQPADATTRECATNPVKATGLTMRKKIRAERSARRTWQRQVRRKLGNRWAKLSDATDMRARCTPTGRQFYCKVSAIPCTYGRRTLGDTPGVEGGCKNPDGTFRC